jgi:DNA-binding transcriptional LysR family regulator
MFCWDDLRTFLAVARTGSTLGAAKSLKVSQTTAARRIAALEQALGLTLFERRQAGYALTPEGEALVARAEAVEVGADAFAEAAGAQARNVGGTLRLTCVEVYAITILPPILQELRAAHPRILIELDTTEVPRDLAAGEADIALRAGLPGTKDGLVGRRIGNDPWTFYCSRSYAAAHKLPRTTRDLASHPIIGGGGSYVWPIYRKWLQHLGIEDSVVLEHGSTAGLLSAIRSGMGMAVLPSFVADRDPDLVRAVDPPPGERMELWLLTHERLRHTPRIRAVMDFLGERLTRLAKQPISDKSTAWAER